MLDIETAERIVHDNIPEGEILDHFTHGHLYVFLVKFGDPEEALFDAHYSVDSRDGTFSEFSMITDYIDSLE